MKVLFYISTISFGGAERVTVNIANELSKRGYDIYIIIDKQIENSYDLYNNIHLIKLNSNKKEVVENLKKQLISIKPDVIIGVLPYAFERLLNANKDLNIPIIASDHSNFHFFHNEHHKFIRTELYNSADVTTVLTKTDYEYMKDRLHNMKVMYNPLTFPRLVEPVNKEKKILCMGRLNAWKLKGFDTMISIWGNIARRFPDWTLVIAGDDKDSGDMEKLKWMAENAGITNHIQFLGWVKDVDKLMQRCSIFALPSRTEGFPCVLLEAMSQGCAPIAFSIGGNINEIITNDIDGYVVPDGNLTLFVAKLCKLMKYKDERDRLSQNAIKSMERFEIDKIGDEWEKLLTDVVKKGR